jgi:hypothetical protein
MDERHHAAAGDSLDGDAWSNRRHGLFAPASAGLAASVRGAADVVRSRSLRHLVVMDLGVGMRAMMRMGRRVHLIVTLIQRGRPGAVLVMQVNAVVRHVLALIVRDVRTRQRPDAESLLRHGTAALPHALTLADGAGFLADIVAWGVHRRLGHIASPGPTLDIKRDGHRLPLRLAGLDLAPDVGRYCPTGG